MFPWGLSEYQNLFDKNMIGVEYWMWGTSGIAGVSLINFKTEMSSAEFLAFENVVCDDFFWKPLI